MNIKCRKCIMHTLLFYALIMIPLISRSYTHGGYIPVSCVKGNGTFVGLCTSYQAHMRNDEIPGTSNTTTDGIVDDSSCKSGKRGYYTMTCKTRIWALQRYAYSLSDKDTNCKCTLSSWYECFEPYGDTGLEVDYEYKFSKCI